MALYDIFRLVIGLNIVYLALTAYTSYFVAGILLLFGIYGTRYDCTNYFVSINYCGETAFIPIENMMRKNRFIANKLDYIDKYIKTAKIIYIMCNKMDISKQIDNKTTTDDDDDIYYNNDEYLEILRENNKMNMNGMMGELDRMIEAFNNNNNIKT